MILIAEFDICVDGGILYSHFFIREYVSFSELVSNGGLPINRVYLKKGIISQYCTAVEKKILMQILRFRISSSHVYLVQNLCM
jgi:hypothetical protein